MMATIPPREPRPGTDPATGRAARDRAASYPGAPEDPVREPFPEREEAPRLDLDWLDPLDQTEFDALRLAWAFMQ